MGIVSWCNGNTTGFGPVIQGSNPCETTISKDKWLIINKIVNHFLLSLTNPLTTKNILWIFRSVLFSPCGCYSCYFPCYYKI